MKRKVEKASLLCVCLVWLCLCAGAWFLPEKEISESERRPLGRFPELSWSTLIDGKFMSGFETYSQDQFPLRDLFRRGKALFHYYVAGQKDNNGIYLADGYAVKMEYPLNTESVKYALEKFRGLYDAYLKEQGSRVWYAVVPDKGYYLAERSGVPALDYDEMENRMQEGMPWAEAVDLRDCLSAESYYRTDIHWRQETLLNAAGKICRSLEIPEPVEEDYTISEIPVPFYGVYYGQAALPMSPETIRILESDLLNDCTVWNYETDSQGSVYDRSKFDSRDLYDVFLSGPVSLLRIDNPNAQSDRELIVFRDSFGSSLAPLLVQGYRSVTLVDIRYLSSRMLDRFLDFHGQDVLFLYSVSVLNNSSTLK